MGNITDLIKDVASKNQIIETFAAKVIEINKETTSPHNTEDAYTVNIMRADGAVIKNVRLKASILDLEQGIITIPKKDSWVLASIIDGIETRAFISQFSEVDRLMGRIEATSDPKLFLDYSANGNNIHVRYIKTDAKTETDETKIIDIAKIEFDKDKNFKISYFNEDEKTLASTLFTPDSLTTTFNSIENKEAQERLSLTLKKDQVSVQFTNETGKLRNQTTISPTETNFSLNDEQGVQKQKTTLTKDSIENVFLNGENILSRASLTELRSVVTLGDNISWVSKDKLELKSKDSLFTIDSNGILFDSKKNITIKGDSIKIEAAANTTISGDSVNIN
ncbi:hypothetical protein [Flavobacterium sp.]|uniref:hypothetical protein n=1 Tax=Flavobacterium sp. TaxID=239 RepID=UPI0025C2DEBD|nr:hypothetical protein [Flavobacterium sp.]